MTSWNTCPISLKRSALEDVASGLLYLHNRQPPVIHRDLTSKNVLLTSNLVAKITDMGNSRIVDMRPGQMARTLSKYPGTLVYMPPEARDDTHRYGPSLDIFSFGHLALYTITQVRLTKTKYTQSMKRVEESLKERRSFLLPSPTSSPPLYLPPPVFIPLPLLPPISSSLLLPTPSFLPSRPSSHPLASHIHFTFFPPLQPSFFLSHLLPLLHFCPSSFLLSLPLPFPFIPLHQARNDNNHTHFSLAQVPHKCGTASYRLLRSMACLLYSPVHTPPPPVKDGKKGGGKSIGEGLSAHLSPSFFPPSIPPTPLFHSISTHPLLLPSFNPYLPRSLLISTHPLLFCPPPPPSLISILHFHPPLSFTPPTLLHLLLTSFNSAHPLFFPPSFPATPSFFPSSLPPSFPPTPLLHSFLPTPSYSLYLLLHSFISTHPLLLP